MSPQEFGAQIDRLKRTFGDRAYPEERNRLIYREVKDFDRRWLESVVDGLIANCRQAPILADFAQVISAEKERVWKKTRDAGESAWVERTSWACAYCCDSGVFLARKDSEPGPSAFRCHCERGGEDSRRAIPQFKSDHSREGFYWVDIKPRERE